MFSSSNDQLSLWFLIAEISSLCTLFVKFLSRALFLVLKSDAILVQLWIISAADAWSTSRCDVVSALRVATRLVVGDANRSF